MTERLAPERAETAAAYEAYQVIWKAQSAKCEEVKENPALAARTSLVCQTLS